jgi:hypothetical protein
MAAASVINRYVRALSKVRGTSYFTEKEFAIASVNWETDIVGKRVCQVQLCHSCFTVLIKMCFQDRVCLRWASHGLQKDESEISLDLALDFMREFLNFVSGCLRTSFDSTKIDLELKYLNSHPDSFCHKNHELTSSGTLAWILSDGTDQVAFVSTVEVLDKANFDALMVDLQGTMATFLANAVKAESMGGIVEKLD